MNEGERRNCQFQRGLMDTNSFYGLLFRAAYKADLENQARLEQGFPNEIEAVRRWRNEDGYAQEIMKEFGERGVPKPIPEEE